MTLPYLQHPVSLRHLLSHTTGYLFSGNKEIEQGRKREDILGILKKNRPQYKAGQYYFYSNIIFSLVEESLNLKNLKLNKIVSILSEILKTQGIQALPLSSENQLAYPHIKKNKPLTLPPYYPKTAPAAAGLFGSLNGMIEFFKLSFGYKPEIIQPKTLENFLSPVVENKDVFNWNLKCPLSSKKIKSYYASGWRILKPLDQPQKQLIFHGGYLRGINTFIGYIPSEEIGIIILTNEDCSFATENGIKFWEIFLVRSSEPCP